MAAARIEAEVSGVHAAPKRLVDMAFAGRDATIMCPYDVLRLSSQAISDA